MGEFFWACIYFKDRVHYREFRGFVDHVKIDRRLLLLLPGARTNILVTSTKTNNNKKNLTLHFMSCFDDEFKMLLLTC